MTPARLLDPMVVLLVGLGAAMLLSYRGAPAATPLARWARRVAVAAWACLWILSTPLFAGRLTGWTEMAGPDLDVALAGKDPAKTALVVLAGGLRTASTAVPPRERLDAATTGRVMGAARLYHRHHFGFLVLAAGTPVEAEAMVDLFTTLGVPEDRLVREERSANTKENALFSAPLLRERGATTVVLATSATHLRRAVRLFERAGVAVVPAPVDVHGPGGLEADFWLPSSWALAGTQVCLHELLGLART